MQVKKEKNFNLNGIKLHKISRLGKAESKLKVFNLIKIPPKLTNCKQMRRVNNYLNYPSPLHLSRV